MRIVVTGGAGFIGSALVPRLLAGGHHVHVVDNLMFGAGSLLPMFINPLFSFQEGDVTNAQTMKKALQGADVVVHLAGLVGYPLCKKLPEQAVTVNVTGTQVVLDHMPSDAFLVYASTGSNYG